MGKKIDGQKAMDCVRMSGNIPAAMLLYIEQNGCRGFKCRGCLLGLVCSHRPDMARDYAHAVRVRILEMRERMRASKGGPRPEGTSVAGTHQRGDSSGTQEHPCKN